MFTLFKDFIKAYRKCTQKRRILNKVRAKLPNYHPVTGERFDWSVSLKHVCSSYDTKTGKPIDPKIKINITKPFTGLRSVSTCDRWGNVEYFFTEIGRD